MINSIEVVMKSRVWFITGASRGFGLEIARAALERGDAVVAAARDPKVVERALGQREQLLAVELDVTEGEIKGGFDIEILDRRNIWPSRVSIWRD
jgi:NAD(P)-dependent dehydrogenase (short-subunit alcohol dehydrogenase family)